MSDKAEKPHERISEVKRQAAAAPVFLQHSFRPFFIAAGIWAAIAVPFWLLAYAGLLDFPDDFDGLAWHRHEMLYGFAGAAICGFILTAIPNWTGRLPVSGWRLGVLVYLWLAGRTAFLAPDLLGPTATAVIDLSFLTALAGVICREIIAGKNWRNAPVLVLISSFAAGNWLIHLELMGLTETAELGLRLSTFILAILVAVIGGRIVPSFTRNWLVREGADVVPASIGKFDTLALASLVLFVIAQVFVPDHALTSYLALLAALLHAARLLRWKGWAVLSEPLLWVMHLAYVWLVVALLMIGLSGLTDTVPASSAIHALTVGAFGTMILAVMTRTSLGHTGRALTATFSTTMIFLLVTVAAVLRVAVPFVDNASLTLLWLSGSAWAGAFLLFAFLYVPILMQARVKG